MTRPSVIDLTITSKNIANQVTDWQILDSVGSDHFGIMFNIQGENTLYIEDASAKTHFRTELANWDLFTTSLKANIAKSAILCSDTLQNIKKLIKPIDILKSQSETLKTLNSTISTTSSRNTPASDFYGQNRRNSNKAPNSSITQIAQLSISATVQENRTNQKERISPATVSVATSPDASIVPFHYLYQDLTGDRARALIAENISLFQKSTDVTYVPPLASQNNSISLPENIGEGSFRASLAPLVTSSPDPANQIPQSQNAELNNSAPNSLIARIAQLPISATVITDFLDLAAQELTDAITESAKAAIPISKPGARAKPWWSHDLLNLRQNMIRAQRLIIYSDADSIRQYLSAKNTYFQAIKQAKREH
jgi:hypothetical protein